MLQGKYVLRREAWRSFDPYYALYSQQELQRALERRARFLPPDAPLPKPHPPSPTFEGLRVAALSGELHSLLYSVFYGYLHKCGMVSERMLTMALRLVELCAEAQSDKVTPRAFLAHTRPVPVLLSIPTHHFSTFTINTLHLHDQYCPPSPSIRSTININTLHLHHNALQLHQHRSPPSPSPLYMIAITTLHFHHHQSPSSQLCTFETLPPPSSVGGDDFPNSREK